jgi:hypothetical protein
MDTEQETLTGDQKQGRPPQSAVSTAPALHPLDLPPTLMDLLTVTRLTTVAKSFLLTSCDLVYKPLRPFPSPQLG